MGLNIKRIFTLKMDFLCVLLNNAHHKIINEDPFFIIVVNRADIIHYLRNASSAKYFKYLLHL